MLLVPPTGVCSWFERGLSSFLSFLFSCLDPPWFSHCYILGGTLLSLFLLVLMTGGVFLVAWVDGKPVLLVWYCLTHPLRGCGIHIVDERRTAEKADRVAVHQIDFIQQQQQ